MTANFDGKEPIRHGAMHIIPKPAERARLPPPVAARRCGDLVRLLEVPRDRHAAFPVLRHGLLTCRRRRGRGPGAREIRRRAPSLGRLLRRHGRVRATPTVVPRRRGPAVPALRERDAPEASADVAHPVHRGIGAVAGQVGVAAGPEGLPDAQVALDPGTVVALEVPCGQVDAHPEDELQRGRRERLEAMHGLVVVGVGAPSDPVLE